jgi:hypothetical protein
MGQTIAESIWEEGRLKGRLEGQLKALRQTLRRLLADRFGTVSETVLQRIESSTDVEGLMSAAVQVSRVAAPEDLPL